MAWMAPFGHSGSHLRHDLHFSGSMYARLFSSVMASNGQTFTHLPQPIQLTLQALLATAPLSLFTHITTIRRLFLPFGRISMIQRGQALAQAPQAVHFSSSTSGKPVSGFMWMASNRHAVTQSPHPRQPKAQAVSPPHVAWAIAHDWAPSYLAVRGRFSQEPLHRTTATLGSTAVASIPNMAAILAIPSAPAPGQSKPSIEPESAAFTQAAAKPPHPGNPHPPQFA